MSGNRPSSNTPARAGAAQSPAQIDPALIQRMLDNQSRELEMRGKEMALRQSELDNSHEFSKLAIDAQERDRRHDREERRRGNRERYVFYLIGALVFMGLVGYAVYMNHTELAQELIKDAGLFLGGGGAGYVAANSKAKSDTKSGAETE